MKRHTLVPHVLLYCLVELLMLLTPTVEESVQPLRVQPSKAPKPFTRQISPTYSPTLSAAFTAIILVSGVSLGHGLSWVFPGWYACAWIGQACLVLLAARHTPRTAFWLGLTVGVLVNGLGFHWAPQALGICMDASWWVAHLLFGLLILWEGVAFAVFSWLASRALQAGPRGLWLVSAAWVVTEHWWPKIFPWLLGYSQLELIPLLQIAELTGPCGIGFCITAIAAWPAGYYLCHTRQLDATYSRGFRTYVAATTLLLICVLSFGFVRMRTWGDAVPGAHTLQIGVAQVNIGHMGSETKLINMTKSIADDVDLVCWPESAIGTYQADLTDFRDQDRTLEYSRRSHDWLHPTANCRCEVLAGGKTYGQDAAEEGPYSMTAFLINPQESILGTYHKRTLLPFGEYMPGEQYLPVLHEWATLNETIKAGESAAPIVTAKGDKLGVVICYEDLVRANVRETVLAGGQVLISLINDSAFENPLTLEQHKRLALLRAVEHRRYLVRCAGTGVTCIVDPTGRILEQLAIGDEGMIVRQVKLSDYQTFYTRFGEWFPVTCALACAGGLVFLRPARS